MTDKSFGDHSNRNIVKNPLLATAVTGLSLEDLTHNAVLLPVVSNQGLISSQDTIQSWTQTGSLVDPTASNVVITQSGDSNTNTVNANPRLDGNVSSFDFHAISLSQNADAPPPGESKASAKSDDDFDVNEYFARLQGTRYVSAPLNRPLAEDSNANLDTEQNLEEINLNDSREAGEVAQSLTADIAQNFSQLPQVLPQVASAVFSSFSSMLSLKSREQTPEYEANKRQTLDNGVYQDVTFAGPQTAAAARNLTAHPSMPIISEPSHAGVEANKAPPPKEPPRLTSTSNTFRMAAKKKTYAQIPGLSSGEPGPTSFHGPSFGIAPEPPSYFDPSQQNIRSPFDSIEERSNISNSEVPLNANRQKDATVTFFNPNTAGNVTNVYTQETNVDMIDNVAPKEEIPSRTNIHVQNLNQSSLAFNVQSPPISNQPQKTPQTNVVETQTPGQIIPPPPMFSNLPPRNDNQSMSSISRSVLPPSVARRIASKPPSSVMPPIDTSILVPTQNVPDVANITQSTPSSNVFQLPASSNVEPIRQVSQYNPSVTSQNETLASTVQSNEAQTRTLFTPSSTIKETESETVVDSTKGPLKADVTAPPTFFNPSSFNIPQETMQPWSVMSTTSSTEVQSEPLIQNPPEPPKPTPEPPKMAPGNFRLTKKRPQYYSGPIEGVGAIGNNVKPVIPTVEQPSTAYRGTFFTPPEQATVQESTPLYSASQSMDRSQIDHPPPAFDISKTTNLEISNPQHTFDLNQEQNQQIYQQPQFNSALDFSRPTTDNYVNPKQEAKGFGIIGSLKSKLGSLDINRIHNSVTTFFDPSYNRANEAQNRTSNNPYLQSNEHSYELFVPNAEEPAQHNPLHPAYATHHSMYQYSSYSNYPGVQRTSASGYYQSQVPFSIYQQLTQPSNTMASQYSQSTTSSVPHSLDSTVTKMSTENRHSNKDREEIVTGSFFRQPMVTETRPHTDAFETKNIVQHQNTTTHSSGGEIKSADPQVQNEYLAQNTTEIEKDVSNISSSFNIFHNTPMNNERSYFDNLTNVTQNEGGGNDITFNVGTIGQRRNTIEAERELFNNNAQQAQFFNVANDSFEPQEEANRIGLQESWFDKDGCDNMMQSKPEASVTQCQGKSDNCDSIFNKHPAVPHSVNETIENDNLNVHCNDQSDLNICETCREVNKHEVIEPEDITTQLIDNITAPIQLLNPVEVSFTENTDGTTDRDGFDTAQCAEITLITQKTIEALQGQPNNDLLCEKTDHEHNFAMVEDAFKKYSYCTNIAPMSEHANNRELDPNLDSMSIFGNAPLLIENPNIMTNASDEVKAEYSIVHDDIVPLILPRQMSVPTAPAREEIDDAKSDSGVIDVQLIEQDAKNDFPIFEEYVIEPSETDDGKIEYRGRDRPSQERDTFTNRVKRYNMTVEEDNLDTVYYSLIDDFAEDVMDPQAHVNHSRHGLRLYESVPNVTSPPKTMASYFDTGNYAAESHYRNSLSSPTSINNMSIIPSSDNVPVFTTDANRINETIDNEDDDATEIHAKEIALETLHLALPEIFEFDNKPFEEKTQENSDSNDFNVQPTTVESTTTSSTASVAERPAISHQEVNSASLPDPASFFSSHVPSNAPQEAQSESDASYNRLASYFSSPAKAADNSKSFFELRQGQNHFRLTGQIENSSPSNRDDDSTNVNTDSLLGTTQSDNLDRRKANADNDSEDRPTKPFFELGLSQNHYKEAAKDFSDQTYIANAQLMRDLTSIENFLPNKDSTVRTVNYFDVVYDCDVKPTEVLNNICNVDVINDSKLNDDETILHTTLSNCKYCCNNEFDGNRNSNEGVGSSAMNEFKVRTAMNPDSDGTDGAREGDAVAGSASGKVNKKKLSVNFEGPLRDIEEGISETNIIENRTNADYTPVRHHWFYRVDCEGKSIWRGFSAADSKALEEAFNSPDLTENTLVPTDGGRFDVNVVGRLRLAVYWTDKPTNVRRCSWFYKGTTDARFIPYTETIANKLEEEYRHGVQTGVWHRRLALPNSEVVVMHGPAVMVHFLQSSNNDWGNSAFFGKRVYRNPPKIMVAHDQTERIDHLLLLVHGAGEWRHQRQKIQSTTRPKVVRRGFDESEIEDTEPSHIDHLLLLCHGVGSACDMRFRAVEEVVDDFRATSLQLVQSHYRNSYDRGDIGRVEMLPISWHSTLHSGEAGVDRRLAQITLDSIPKLRNFTNDTVLDVLFYTSPIFCQTIIDTVCKELNRIYTLFRARNPTFTGGVSLGGHSLGSVILYDLLCHQVASPSMSDVTTKTFVQGSAGTGQPSVRYPSLDFKPESLFALGSPIAIFECIRGVEMLGENFSLPTCPAFFNIFHPYDPIAYRVEPLINPELKKLQPYLIPHHKGRKRMHLELKETMARVGSDLKQKLIESIKATWSSVWRAPPPTAAQLEQVVEEEIEKEEMLEGKDDQPQDIDMTTSKLLGRLNSGRRVDYVLQEAPFEMINEYLFAMTSHVCYWESEDTMLLMLREIYSTLGVQPDSTVPQQTMTVQRTRIFPNDDEMDIGSPVSDKPTTSRNSL